MDKKRLEQDLKERVELNYRSFFMQMEKKPITDIIAQAEEIAATKLVHDELMKGCNEDYILYLLRFENPLALVRDQWVEKHKGSHSDELEYILWEITDKRLGEGDYAPARKRCIIKEQEEVHLC